MNDAFPHDSDGVRTWSDCAVLLSHALTVAGYAGGLDAAPEATGCLLNSAGIYLSRRGDLNEAKAAIEKAHSIYETVYGKDSVHPYVALTHMNLGNVLRKKGDLDEAETAFEKALDMYEEVYGHDSNHPSFALALKSLTTVQLMKSGLDSANR